MLFLYKTNKKHNYMCAHMYFFSFRKIAKLRMIFPKVFMCRTEHSKVPSRLSRVHLCLI